MTHQFVIVSISLFFFLFLLLFECGFDFFFLNKFSYSFLIVMIGFEPYVIYSMIISLCQSSQDTNDFFFFFFCVCVYLGFELRSLFDHKRLYKLS